MSEIDLKLIYERFDSIDKQLKELREATKSIPIKIDYPISKSRQPQCEEDLKPKYLNLFDNEQWDEENK